MPSITLFPSQSTYISDRHPDFSYPDKQNLYVGVDADGNLFRTFLLFDMCLLPQDIFIEKAVLQMHTLNSFFRNKPGLFTPYAVTSFWDLKNITWNNHPSFIHSVPVHGNRIPPYGVKSWDVTDMTRVWLINTEKNFGLFIKSTETYKNDIKSFYSAVSASSFKRRVPSLKIIYHLQNSSSLASRNTFSTCEVLDVNDSLSYSTWQNTSVYSMYTFFVQNVGSHPACVFTQISPDTFTSIDEPTAIHIEPGKAKAIVPQKFAYFTRLAFQSSFPRTNTSLKVWFQSQV